MESKTIEFFKEISKIPRESGNEKQISDYICNWAKQRNLEYVQDKYNNVIVKKNDGKNLPIILQAHIDMVCEKEANINFNFEKDSIKVYEDEGFLKAKGTTLGADNGIGVAQILNILDSDMKINIEAIFTVSEETTMIGAENIDVSMLKGKQMINLDGFEENTILIESASFFDIIFNTKYSYIEEKNCNFYKLSLQGMLGGHSGFDIDKKRGNSSIELANLLKQIPNIKLAKFVGGTKFNVIPSQAECIFYSTESEEEIRKIVQKFNKEKRNEYENIEIKIEKIDSNYKTVSEKDTLHFINSVINFKHGIFFKNESYVTTSANLGVVNLEENIMKIGVRSSRKSEEEVILEYLKKYCRDNDFEFVQLGFQSGFETKKDSQLVQKLWKAYEKSLGNSKIKTESVHITVEAGFFKEKIQNLEVAIISPKITGAHTVNEKVEIQSIINCDKWLNEFLKNNI